MLNPLSFRDFIKESQSKESHEKISIEFLDSANNWRKSMGGVDNSPQMIAWALNNAKKLYPDKRVRAVGSSTGKFYDMIP